MTKKSWTQEDDDYIIGHYLSQTPRELAERFSVNVSIVYARMRKLELSVPQEIKSDRRKKAYAEKCSGENHWNWQGGIRASLTKSEYKKLQRLRNPLATRARNIIEHRLCRGTLVRQPCSVCGSTENVQAHHPDYKKPTEIIWLCRPCHFAEHKRIKESHTNNASIVYNDIETNDLGA